MTRTTTKSPPPPPTTATEEMAPELTHVLPTATKGYAVFATQTIPPGTTLLHDKPILRLMRGTHDITPTQLTQALHHLSKKDHAAFLSLHENSHLPYTTRTLRIYKSNCFGDASTSWLSLQFARVNHSCAPNAEITEIDSPDGARMVAIKPIESGEEVCISYLGPGEDGRGEERRRLLRGTYGFECGCEACTVVVSSVQGWVSDVRRGCVAVLAARQMGMEARELREVVGVNGTTISTTTNASRATTTVPPPPPPTLGYASHRPLQQPLTPREKVQTNVLLALLLEAEGLINYRLAQAWVHAAVALMAQMQDLKPVVVLPAARTLEVWLQRAVEVMGRVRSEGSRDLGELRGAVAVLVGCGYVVTAKRVMGEVEMEGKRKRSMKKDGRSGEVRMVGERRLKGRSKTAVYEERDADREVEEDVFATISGKTHRWLTQRECVEYVRKMKGRGKRTVDVLVEGCD